MFSMNVNDTITRTAVITGGSSGIGRAITTALCRSGWNTTVLDPAVPADPFENNVLFIQGSVSNESDVIAAVDQTVERFGRLDALVNNAGIGINKPMEELLLEEWNRVISTNLTGTFLCSKAAAPHLRISGGSIINIGSTRSRQSEAGTEAYSATKGGISSLTHAMAVSLGPEIRVNCISPGWIDTRPNAIALQSETDRIQHPCGRVGTPNDIAEMVLFLLAADKAGFITGQEFFVDGGMTRKMIYTE